MRTPSGVELVLLVLAAFRVTRLVGWDEITRRPRAWLCGLADNEYDRAAAIIDTYEAEGADPWSRVGITNVSPRRYYLAKLIHCPWCVGFWISLATAGAWWAWPDGTVVVAVPLALSAGVGLIAKNGDP